MPESPGLKKEFKEDDFDDEALNDFKPPYMRRTSITNVEVRDDQGIDENPMLFRIQNMISSINEVISNYDEAKNQRKVLSGIEEDDIGLSIDSINEEDAFD